MSIKGEANKLFKSYLENREQFVKVNGVRSSCTCITCGVAQGTILGPILFIAYINDLMKYIKQAYADLKQMKF